MALKEHTIKNFINILASKIDTKNMECNQMASFFLDNWTYGTHNRLAMVLLFYSAW